MSNYQAIRGMAETLRTLLSTQMVMNSGLVISFGPPDLEPQTKVKRLNLYLYKIIENAFLKNQDIPGEGYPAAYGHPPLSLVLYFLLTPFTELDKYNKDYDLVSHELLADAMRVFHDYPILTDEMEIELSPGNYQKLLHSSLQNQFEKVKITLEPLDTEELTKIWMGFNSAYRLSVGYAVSVVQIESEKPKRIARPVEMRRVHMVQIRRPQIDDLIITPPPIPPADFEMPPATGRIGDTMELKGINLKGITTKLLIGEAEFDVIPESNTLIKFPIPDDPKLQPGVSSIYIRVRVTTEIVEGGYEDRGDTISGANIMISNQIAFMLAPKITSINPTSGTASTILTVQGQRLYKSDLKSYVIIGDTAIEIREPSDSSWASPTPTEVQVPLTALNGVSAGNYPVRIRVKGAESLEKDKEFTLT